MNETWHDPETGLFVRPNPRKPGRFQIAVSNRGIFYGARSREDFRAVANYLARTEEETDE